jgi:hypothetical protein
VLGWWSTSAEGRKINLAVVGQMVFDAMGAALCIDRRSFVR